MALVTSQTRFGPKRVAADMEGNGEFDFWRFLRIFGEFLGDFWKFFEEFFEEFFEDFWRISWRFLEIF